MRDALIFAGLTIGAVATVFGGGEANLVAPPATQPTAATVVTEPGQAEDPAWGGTTELQRAGDGHFYAGVGLGGRSLTMLVDTGATVIALTGDDARAAGLHWNPADLAVVARGASGPIHGVAVTLERVTLGGHEARDVPAVIVPEGLPISLLGQSFLSTIEPVRIEKDRMVLGG